MSSKLAAPRLGFGHTSSRRSGRKKEQKKRRERGGKGSGQGGDGRRGPTRRDGKGGKAHIWVRGPAGPPEGIAIFGALFAGQPRIYGKYYPRQVRLRLHPNLTIPPGGPSTASRVYQPTDPAMKKQRPKYAQRLLHEASLSGGGTVRPISPSSRHPPGFIFHTQTILARCSTFLNSESPVTRAALFSRAVRRAKQSA